MLNRESIQQVIQRADIVEVIGQFVNLKKRGANYIANCPFHNEKTPSFNVNPAKGIFKCFGCGKGGDTVSFIEEYEKFSFVEAIRWLAKYYSIELEETEMPEEAKIQKQIEESLRIINEFAEQYFQDILWNNEEGKIIGGQYFKERGFQKSTIKEFHLGYCLDQWDNFTQAALKKGFSAELLEQAGLIKNKSGKLFDSYKGRIIFPIFSNTGKVLGFGARILKKNEHAPKYINSPENELYVKNKVLYGLFQSRQSIVASKECLLVEGYTDVIALHQGGIKNVVASSGTSLTEGQLKLIGNLTKNLVILYDGDAAGIKAAMRGIGMALSDSFKVKLVLLPEGHDPDSFIQANGAEDFRDFIDQNKRDFIEFRLETSLADVANDPLKKAELVNEMAETISKINKAEDFTLQSYYIKKCAKDLDIEEEGMVTLVNKFIRERIQQDSRHQLRKEEKDIEEISKKKTLEQNEVSDAQRLLALEQREEWQLLRVLLEYGTKPYDEGLFAEYFFQIIDLDLFENILAKKIALAYYHYWENYQILPPIQFFINHEDKSIKTKTADLLYEAYQPNHGWKEKYKIEVPFGEELYKEEIKSSFAYFELKLLRKLIQKNLKELQKEKDTERITVLNKTHLDLKLREKGLMELVIIK